MMTITIQNNENICRICAVQSKLVVYKNIFEIKTQNGILASEALSTLAGFEISKDDEPIKVICSYCENRLNDAFHLMVQACSTARMLTSVIGETKSKLDGIPTPTPADTNLIEKSDPTNQSEIEENNFTNTSRHNSISSHEQDNENNENELSSSSLLALSELKAENIADIIHGNSPNVKRKSIDNSLTNEESEKMPKTLLVKTAETALTAILRKTALPKRKRSTTTRCLRRRTSEKKRRFEKKSKILSNKEDAKIENPDELTDESMDAVDFVLANDAMKMDLNNDGGNDNDNDDDVKDESYEKRKHKCEVCGKRFVGKSNLIDHLRYHANVKPYECTYCDRKFVQAGSLKCHIRTHTREKPYVCDICEKAFSQPSGLKVHVRTHTNERNYVCEICTKAFVSKGDLNKHQRIHDPVKKFVCNVCNWGFAQKCNLDKHKAIVHDDKKDK